MENDVLTPYLFLIFSDLSDYKANSTLHPDFTLIIFAQAYALCFLLAALFSTIHAFSNKCIISFYILPFKQRMLPDGNFDSDSQDKPDLVFSDFNT